MLYKVEKCGRMLRVLFRFGKFGRTKIWTYFNKVEYQYDFYEITFVDGIRKMSIEFPNDILFKKVKKEIDSKLEC